MTEGLIVDVQMGDPEAAPADSVGGDLRVFPAINAFASGSDLPYDINITALFNVRSVPVRNLIAWSRQNGEWITTEGLRRVPVGRILQEALEKLVIEGEWRSALVEWGPDGVFVHTPPKGPDEDALMTVAALYRLAHMVSVPRPHMWLKLSDYPNRLLGAGWA